MTVRAQQAQPANVIACQSDNGFADWLAQSGGSLAVSTYQAGKVLLVGWDGNQLQLLPRHFEKPMGLDVQGDRLVLATRDAITFFHNDPLLAPSYLPHQRARYDALYLPRTSYFTTDLNIHDLALNNEGQLWMATTRFSCLATLSHDYNFVPQWKPSFISAIAPEDRCHLNGLALKDNKPAWITALGETDHVAGWRDGKLGGGIVMDVANNEVILRGLAMPHSPRWYQDKLWVLSSGTGELLQVDPNSGDTEVVCALPAYLRGLCFSGNHALIGMCKIRETNIFGGMPVQEKHEKLKCGVAVVSLSSGEWVGTLEFTAGCTEIYDVRMLDGVQRPNILNLEKEAARQAVSTPEFSYWLRPENAISGGKDDQVKY